MSASLSNTVVPAQAGIRYALRAVRRPWIAAFAGMTAMPAQASEASGAIGATGVVEVFGSLLLVIGAIFALAWLARWLQGARIARGTAIQIRGGAQLGAKEKVVLLQVGETQFLVGVASSSVSLLHRFESAVTDDPPPETLEPSFAERLRQALSGRNAT